MTTNGVDPFAAAANWMKMWQLAAFAPVVIGYRLAGMALAGPNPTARDRREFTRMGQEKVDAWFEAARATAAFATSATTLSTKLWADTLTPYHRRVVANRRRLSRR